MSILSICDNVDVLSVLRIVKIVITIIKIAVPIILILSLAINYMSAIKSNDNDLLTKANKSAVSKIIAALLIFFIPTFVNLIARISSFDNAELFRCINNATPEKIDGIRAGNAKQKLDIFKENPTSSNYSVASSEINKVKDNAERSNLLKELEENKKYIEITEALNKLKNNRTSDNKKKASELIEALPDSDPHKEKYVALLKEYGVGTRLNVESGIQEFRKDNLTYFVYIPPEPTTNMPVLLWLHGDNYILQWAKNVRFGDTAHKAGYNVITIVPFVGPDMGHSVSGWYEGGLLPNVKDIVEEVCNKYECDRDNINIGGHSRGAIGTWMMVSMYPNYFHAAAPVSCCSFYGIKPESFKGVKVWATRGSGAGSGDDNDDKYGCMQGDVDKVKPYAKEVKYVIQPRTTHSQATDELQMSEEFSKFMFDD